MKKRVNKKAFIILSILIMIIIVMSIAFSVLSSTLSISNNNLTQNIESWNVGFVANSALEPFQVGGTSNTGRNCGKLKVTATSVSLATGETLTLSKPGDWCTYKLTVSNSGTIAAKLSSITFTNPTGITCTVTENGAKATCNKLIFQLTMDSSGNGNPYVQPNDVINAGTNIDMYLIIWLQNSATLTSTNINYTNPIFNLVYSQK